MLYFFYLSAFLLLSSASLTDLLRTSMTDAPTEIRISVADAWFVGHEGHIVDYYSDQ